VQQAAQCRLTIIGRKKGIVYQAGMRCTGASAPTVALNPTYLGRARANFTEVNLVSSCTSNVTQDGPCLLTLCSGTIILRNSRVSWVRNVPLKGLVCVVNNSMLEVYKSRFSMNMVRPLVAGDQASIVLRASNVSNNTAYPLVNASSASDYLVVDGSGVGLRVDGYASIVITDSSRVVGNIATQDGGGLWATGNACLLITGGSIIHNNTAVRGGGGVSVWGNECR
jgi:hypothetical protein